MKNLMKLFSLILIVALCCIIGFNFIFPATDMPLYVTELLGWLLINAIPILIIAISCYCVQMKDSGILVRIILAYTIFSIIISACITFLPLEDINTFLKDILTNINTFLVQTQPYILAYVLLAMVRPNNVVCNTIRKIALAALIFNIIIQVYLYVKIILVDKLPNVYGNDGFNFTTIAETAEFTYKVMLASIYVEVFSIILTFITNYAFEEDTINSEQIDYEELKKQADYVAMNKIQNIYSKPEVVNTPDRSVSEKTGLMNINNQLGTNSNVGQMNNPTSIQNTIPLEVAIPTSNGPVINESIEQNNNTNNQVQQ